MEKIEIINYIKSPSSKVYQALTSEEGLGTIWTSKLKVKPVIGYIYEFNFNEDPHTKMLITGLHENQWISWECLASNIEWVGTTVSFNLKENNGTTAVLLKHCNWREITDYYRWCNYNWSMFLYRLKDYCENKVEMAGKTALKM
ncbi:MAG: SRPBCC domain-containing protein [Balneolales bacterium]|nr:SRPBCC domain-containing protein [Balneolales bacterium]